MYETAKGHAVAEILRFVGLTFLITLGTGYVIVLSNHAELVHGAHQVQHPIRLPLAIAIVLVIIGGWSPGISALLTTAWTSRHAGVRNLLRQFCRWNVHPLWYMTALFRTSSARGGCSRRFRSGWRHHTATLVLASFSSSVWV